MAQMVVIGQTKSINVAPSQGAPINLRALLGGEAVVADYFDAVAEEGRVYSIGLITSGVPAGTADAATLASTTPFLLVDIPSGVIGVPLHLTMNVTAAGGAAGCIVAVVGDPSATRYASGGTALTVYPQRTDNPVPTTIQKAYVMPTATASSGKEQAIWGATLDTTALGKVNSNVDVDLASSNSTPMFFVGPASLLVYSATGTGRTSWDFKFTWAELPASRI